MPGPNIRVVEDRARVEGGHAIIQVAGVAQYQGDGTIGIRRLGYEAAHLSPEGWRIAEARVTADSYDVRNGVASFYVGPEVTRHLTPDDQVALDVGGIAGQAVLIWPAITPFYEGKTEFRRFSARRAAPPPPPPEEEVTVMTPRPVPPPEPVAPEPVTPEPLVATREDVAPDKVKEKPARRTGLIGVLAATVWCVACFALGAVIYDVLVAETPVVATAEPTPPALPEPAPETPPETPPSLPEPTPAPAPTPTPAPEPAPTPGPRSVRDIVRDAANPQELFDEAMKFRAQGDHQGMLLLLENAAERGHARAIFEIARLYDPASFVEGQPFSRPNPGQAAKFYRKAEAAGIAEAGPALAALKTRLEAAAAAGDLDARSALSTYWPGTTP